MKQNHIIILLAAASVSGAALANIFSDSDSQGKVIAMDPCGDSISAIGLPASSAAAISSPFRVGATGSSIFGFMGYRDEEDFLPGWYEVAPDGSLTRLWKYHYAESGVGISSAWLRNGRLCALASFTLGSDDMVTDYAYQEMDPITGELILSRVVEISDDRTPYFVSSAYCPADDRIYGFGKCGENYSETIYFKSAPADTPEQAEVIVALDAPGLRCPSFCYSEADRCFYGVNTWGAFVRLLTDGTYEELFPVEMANLSSGKGALTESPNDGFLLWNPNVYSNSSALYAIYPSSKRIELLCDFEKDCQFSAFLSTDGGVDDSAPSTPDFVGADFKDASLTGKLQFIAPSEARDGNPLGKMDFKLFDNGSIIEEGTVEASSALDFDVATTEGIHTFRLEVEADGLKSLPSAVRMYIGNDTPLSPSDVNLTSSEVVWSPVSAGIHGGFINPDGVTYRVSLNGEVIGETDKCSFPVSIDADKVQDVYRASVVALFAHHESESAWSDRHVIGRPYDLPMHIAPTAHDAEMVSIFNLDGSPDYGVWRLSDAWGDLCFASGWSMEKPDDWLILPAAGFPSNEILYSVSIEAARGGYTGQQEYFEVWAGTSPNPEALTIPVIGKTRAQKFNDWKEYSGVFAVPRAGTYYIAVRSVSEPDQKDLIVRNIRVEATATATAVPMPVAYAAVTSTDDTAPSATLEFVLPSSFLNGDPIAPECMVTAVAQASADGEYAPAVEVSGVAGEKVSVVVPTLQGENYITITSVVDGIEGQKAEISVFTGMDILSFVEDYTAVVTDDNMGMHLSWRPPLETLNGGYFATSGIRYWVAEVETDGNFITEPVLAGTDITEFTYILPAGTPQRYARVAVVAENAAGISPARWYQARVIGEPYHLPLEEHFDGMEPEYGPLVGSSPSSDYSEGAWSWCQPELVNPDYADPDAGFAIIGYTDTGNARVRMHLPKVSTVGTDCASAWFAVWTGNGAASDMRVYATSASKTITHIATLPSSGGWNMARIEIPEQFIGEKWINLSVDAYIADAEKYFILHSYGIDPFSSINSSPSPLSGDAAGEKGCIVITGFDGCRFAVYNPDGRLVANGICGDCRRINVAPGIYIVSVDGRSFKLSVK